MIMDYSSLNSDVNVCSCIRAALRSLINNFESLFFFPS